MALINCALYNIGDLCCVKLKCYFVVKVNRETMLFCYLIGKKYPLAQKMSSIIALSLSR